MSQPTFIPASKIDGSSAAANNLTLTPGVATSGTNQGRALLVGIALTATGLQSLQSVAGIIDSAGTPIVGGISTGVPVNNWVFLGSSNNQGITMAWYVCKGAVSITWLTINLTGSGAEDQNAIWGIMLEYSGASGISFPNFQSLQTNQNPISTQYILETAAVDVNENAASIMIGLFSMLNDTFNSTPPTPSFAIQTVRSTNTRSLPPAFSYQVIEQDTTASQGYFTSGGERVTLASGSLNVTAESATQLATVGNLAASTMQCLYIVISGGLLLNTPPGFNDQQDSTLAAGNYALGSQLAKISGNAALGMCRMEFFSGLFSNGQNAAGPWVSTVDGYTYSPGELTYLWGVYSSANPSTGQITGPTALWYCGWGVDQETGDVTCIEWYRNDSAAGFSNDGILQVFIIAQRQQQNLTVAVTPTWTQQQASTFVTDVAYAQDVLSEMNDNAKFAVVGQECILMRGPGGGGFKNGDTVPRPVSLADDYEYAYSEVTFAFSWMFTTESDQLQQGMTAMPWIYGAGSSFNLAALGASVNPSTGVVSVAVGMGGNAGNGYYQYSSLGMIQVVAFCQRTRTGTPATVANKFAEISNALFYPGNPIPAGLAAQIVNNTQEAALTPEFFGPTLYELGATIPLPVSTIDGYAYQASEVFILWEWGEMVAYPSWPPPTSANQRTSQFAAQVNPDTGYAGIVANTVTAGPPTTYTSVVWRLPPGGPYTAYNGPPGTVAAITVIVVGCRSAQQAEITPQQSTQPGGGVTVSDLTPSGPITVNGA
ncbi:MAG: hypothetical protein WCB56_17780 [Terriglobales bacterium]